VVLVHFEFARVLGFEVEKAFSPIHGGTQERFAGAHDMASVETSVGYAFYPFRGDSPAFYVFVLDPSRRGVRLPDRAAMSVGAGLHAARQLVVEVRLEDLRQTRRDTENRVGSRRRHCRGCRCSSLSEIYVHSNCVLACASSHQPSVRLIGLGSNLRPWDGPTALKKTFDLPANAPSFRP